MSLNLIAVWDYRYWELRGNKNGSMTGYLLEYVLNEIVIQIMWLNLE